MTSPRARGKWQGQALPPCLQVSCSPISPSSGPWKVCTSLQVQRRRGAGKDLCIWCSKRARDACGQFYLGLEWRHVAPGLGSPDPGKNRLHKLESAPTRFYWVRHNEGNFIELRQWRKLHTVHGLCFAKSPSLVSSFQPKDRFCPKIQAFPPLNSIMLFNMIIR